MTLADFDPTPSATFVAALAILLAVAWLVAGAIVLVALWRGSWMRDPADVDVASRLTPYTDQGGAPVRRCDGGRLRGWAAVGGVGGA